MDETIARLVHIGRDGIVTDEYGLPVPRSEVAQLVKQIVVRYAGLKTAELEKIELDRLTELGPAYVEQFLGSDLS